VATILAALTNIARININESGILGRAYKVLEFQIGNEGYDPGNPSTPLTPDITLSDLPGVVFGPKAVTTAQLINVYVPQFFCVLEPLEAVGDISSIGLYAEFVYDPVGETAPGLGDGPLKGTKFFYAIGNFGRRSKSSLDTVELTIEVYS
jgi:hypothetical protein